jgi:AraC-like DNA-binding protein
VDFSTAKYMFVGRLTPSTTWAMGRHEHPYHELIAVLRGVLHVRLDRRDHRVYPGDFILYKAGHAHTERADSAQPLETFFVSFVWPEADALPVVCHDTAGRVRQLCQWLHQERTDPARGSRQLCDSFFAALTREWARLLQRREHPLLEQARDFVRQNIDQTISVGGLAALAGMSKFHFVRRFKHLTGRTPMEEVRQQRVAFARDLILTTDLPLKDVATRAGLGDQQHLARLLRRYLGLPPSHLRRAPRA